MSENNVVENSSTKKGTVKIDVSRRVKDQLTEIRDNEEHTSMDSVIRSLLDHRGQITAAEWARTLRHDGYKLYLMTQQEAGTIKPRTVRSCPNIEVIEQPEVAG